MTRRAAWALLLGAASCAAPEVAPHAPPAGPADLFSRVEKRLLSARAVRVKAAIVATGAIAATIDATLSLEAKRAELRATGTLAGTAVDVRYESAGGAPPFVKEAFVVGLMRMGLLHNVAVLHGGAGPDHAEGGVDEWVQAVDHAFSTDERTVRFGIVVSGQPSGEAELAVDEARMVPRSRAQVVHFAKGDMSVRETYEVEIRD